jgi:1-acyl-sn-glycerol-3-phosphate acyltransferase
MYHSRDIADHGQIRPEIYSAVLNPGRTGGLDFVEPSDVPAGRKRWRDGRRAAWRASAAAVLTVILVGPYALAGLFGRRARRPIARAWFTALQTLGGIEVRVVGTPRRDRPTLYVANHVSYLDIIVLGRLLDGLFVAKSEIAAWPGIGWLARLGGTLFVRRSLEHAREQCDMLTGVIEGGSNVILFPEGTSGLGDKLLPLKSTLFEVPYRVAPERNLVVQPVTIAYLEAGGAKCRNRRERSLVAWYGRMTLLPHLWRFLSVRGTVVELHFAEPLEARDFAWRRDLANACRDRLAAGLSRAFLR